MTHSPTRRTVLLATGAVTLTAGCGEYGNENSDSGSSSVEASAGTELAKTSEIPVGGGKVFGDQEVVVTQPSKGRFEAFSAICTHQGCPVNEVSDGRIMCPCHGSMFSIKDGSVVGGPTTYPARVFDVRIRDGQVEVRAATKQAAGD